MTIARIAAVAVHIALSFLSVATSTEVRPSQRDLKPKPKYGTEDENEFVRVVEPRPVVVGKVTVKSMRPHVGDFELNVDQNFPEIACGHIEGQFRSLTSCVCSLSMMHSSAVRFGCQHHDVSCNQWQVCARHEYVGAVSLDSPVLSSELCLRDLRILGEDQSVGDLCLSVNHDRDGLGVKTCMARIGGKKCSCAPCDGGSGIRLDCSSRHESLLSTKCDSINLVSAIKGERVTLNDFLPTFAK